MNFIEIENTFGDFSIKGFISKPTYFKGNRSYQTTIINGRVIENQNNFDRSREGLRTVFNEAQLSVVRHRNQYAV